ncbi:MAG: insulinase family protein [Rhizobiales bacterium]|nr:insulinase family protein [Hyphomicrobiales bacterium]
MKSFFVFCAIALSVMLGFAAPAAAMKIEKVVSPGGIEAWLVEEDQVPVIVMQVAWQGGSAYDPKGKEGLANMVTALLDEGAGEMDSQTFQKKLDDIAVQMSFSEGRDTFSGSLKTLADKRDEAFALFAAAITQPRFDKDPVERIRGQIAVRLARNLEDPDWIASNAWNHAAYGDHPYAHPRDGMPASLARITRQDLMEFTQNVFARDDMKIAVVGPIKPEELGKLLDSTFGGLPEVADLPEIPEVTMPTKAQTIVIKRDFPQSVALFGMEGIKRDDPDFIPAFVMNYVLGGGGFSSRLTEEVREKRGLAYSVGTNLNPLDHAASIVGSVGTQNARMGQSLAVIKAELARMAKDGLSEKELADAKTFLTGSYPLRFASNDDIASQLLGIQIENLGIDYVDKRNGLIEAVTQADTARVAARLLKPDIMIVTVVGQPDLSVKPEGMAPDPAMIPHEPAGHSEGAPRG